MESLPVRADLGAAAGAVPDRVRRPDDDLPGRDDGGVRILVHRPGLLQGTEAREAAAVDGLPLRFSPLHYVHDPVTPRIVHAIAFAAALGVTLGWRTRTMSIVLWLAMLSLYHRNPSSNGGPDAMPMILTFYMMLCPSGAAYSLDARREARRRGTLAEPLIVPWAVRLLQMQFCLIYFQSCEIKCGGADLDQRHGDALRALQPRIRLVQPGMAGRVSVARST